MEINLIVQEALQMDVGKQIAKISHKTAEKLKLKTGDYVSLSGTRTTYSLIWKSRSNDLAHNSIRLDPITRENLNVNLADTIKLKAVVTNIASNIEILLLGSIAFSDRLLNSIKINLINKVVAEGDVLNFNIALNQTLKLKIIQTSPKDAVIINSETIIAVSNKSSQKDDKINGKSAKNEAQIVSYEDIGGLDEPIRKIREMIELPLKFPDAFLKLGVKPPKGLLLFGPPGTGKTLLARAVAFETSSHFVKINGPEIMSKFYGESETKLRQIFERASNNSPSIIFIDEIDSIAPKRLDGTGETEKRIVSQLLTLMDGIENRGEIVVIGATNLPNSLDSALRRGGRFDREIELGVPNAVGRLEILQILTRGMPLAGDVNLQDIATKTQGFVGADFATVIKESALLSLRRVLPKLNLSRIDTLSPELLEELVVTHNDLQKAINEIVPTGLREISHDKPEITFADIGGLEDIKDRLIESVAWPIKHMSLFKEDKIPPVKSILLYGQSGNGKKSLAKALANESGANFVQFRSSKLASSYGISSANLLEKLFRKAKLISPTILFLGNIDFLLSDMDNFEYPKNRELLSQLISEIDNLDFYSGVFVIATSNISKSQSAIIKPLTFFEEKIRVIKPNSETRKEITNLHFPNLQSENIEIFNMVIKETKGFNSSNLVYLLQETKRFIVKRKIALSLENYSIDIKELAIIINRIFESLNSSGESLKGSLSYYD